MPRSGFLRWWGRELAACLPGAWRADRVRSTPRLELELAREAILARHYPNGRAREIGRLELRPRGRDAGSGAELGERLRLLDPRRTRVAVRLGAELRLRKRVRLPLAAEENLHQVLGFELHRETPFSADRAYYDYRLLGRDQESLEVELWAAPREPVDRALDLLEDWALVQDTDHHSAPAEPDLLWFHATGYRPRSAAAVNSVLLLANLAVAGALLGLPAWRQHAEAARLEPRLEALRARAAEAAAIEERAARLAASLEALERRKRAYPPVVVILEELARALPDSTWLDRLELRSGKLTIHGTSSAASTLIARLQDAAMFRDAQFVSPITQSPDGRERFRLSARVVPPGRAPD